MLPLISETHKILVIGSGNSSLSESMYESGLKHITNIDISQNVINMMQDKNRDKPEMTWRKMDMLDMQFESGHFDIAVDKATMDVLQCDNEDCWNPSEEVLSRVKIFYDGCYRVLNDTGRIIQISFDQPHFRRKYIDFSKWRLSVQTIEGGSFPYFLYILDKL